MWIEKKASEVVVGDHVREVGKTYAETLTQTKVVEIFGDLEKPDVRVLLVQVGGGIFPATMILRIFREDLILIYEKEEVIRVD